MKEYYFAKGKFILEGTDCIGELGLFEKPLPYDYIIEAIVTEEDIPQILETYSPDGSTTVAKVEQGHLFYASREGDKPSDGLISNKEYSKLYSCISRTNRTNTETGEVLIDTGFKRLRVVYDAVLPMHGGTALHASCIKYNDYAICFCGSSGTGKSTHARLWESRFNAPMISSDTPTIYPEKQGGATAYGMPWDGSDHVITQDSKPVKAIVELRQAKYNSVRKLSEKQAFQLLLKQGHMPMWDSEAMFMEMMVLKKISKSVPFYRLNCLPNEEAAETIEEVLFKGKAAEKEEKEMKIKDGYILRNVMGDYIVMPTGDNMKSFEGAIVLSETSAFVWEKLQKNVSKTDLLKDVLSEFDVDEATASADIDALIEKLKSFDVIEEID